MKPLTADEIDWNETLQLVKLVCVCGFSCSAITKRGIALAIKDHLAYTGCVIVQ